MVRREPVLNPSDDLKEQIIMDTMCWDGEGDPRVGVLAIETMNGVYQFFISELGANELIQQLRDFISEDAERLP
ncbi:hypothetical protein IVA94_14790 [Bradyrhizobium sp. 156]|uniref:hypothetical protein n=1 Tax=Bradyrhizobium sp. 156 TaxID=2782630 RepID=UPI001FF7957D|nr:hypothetical protein [Bradyrhizobium sp. 156]MCK1322135.1 hypothetical protein [Bradyrhizobium sp. 156]